MRVKLPRLLTSDMREKARLHPLTLEIELNLDPPSVASMTIPRTDAAVKLRDWVELYTKDGSAGIYRVTGVDASYDGEQTALSLEHGICALGDAVINAEGTFEGSLDGLMGTLLAHQVTQAGGAPLWAVGETVNTEAVRHEYQNPNLLTEIVRLVNQAGDVMLTYDQTSLPWKLGLKRLADADECEGRFSRNIQSMTVDVDDSELCTRLYIDGREGHRDADTLAQYGAVERVINVSEYATDASAERYIADYLESHKDPDVTIELNAYDLADATGEPLDAFRLGRLCRACLPDYGVTVRERVIGIRYPDVYGNPQNVRVSLGKKQKNLADLIIDEEKRSAAASSRTSRNYYRNSSRIGRTEVNLEKTYEYVDTVDGNLTEYKNYVGIQLDEINGQVRLKASQQEMNDTRERMSVAGITLDGPAASVKILASQSELDKTNGRLSTAESTITVQAGQISSKVSKDGVISSINQTPEEVKIKASKINLEGYVTASELSALKAELANVISGTIQASLLYTQNLTATNVVRLSGHTCKWSSLEVCTGVHYRKELLTIPVNGVNYAPIGSVSVWGDYETINFMSY